MVYDLWIVLAISVVGMFAGWALGYFAGNKLAAAKIAEAELKAKSIIKDAEKDASNINQLIP